MLLATFIASVGYAVQKHVLLETDVKTLFFWGRVGDVLCATALLLAAPLRRAFLTTTT